MVSKASEDLPDPLGPVNTTILPRGRLTLTFFRLCCRAPTTMRRSTAIANHASTGPTPSGARPGARLWYPSALDAQGGVRVVPSAVSGGRATGATVGPEDALP